MRKSGVIGRRCKGDVAQPKGDIVGRHYKGDVDESPRAPLDARSATQARFASIEEVSIHLGGFFGVGVEICSETGTEV